MAKVAEPTLKQKLFVKNKLKGMTDKAAAIKAGYSLSSAKNTKHDIKEKQGYKKYENSLASKLEEMGVNDEYLAKKIKEGMDATKPTMFSEVEDYPTRLAYIKYSTELQGKAPKVEEGTSGNPNIIIKIGLINANTN